MLPKSQVQENMSKPNFYKSLPLRGDWKSKSMRIIPREIVRSTQVEHRVVFSVRWGNSWQFWLRPDKNKDLFMIEEDWDEFVDDNFLQPNNTLFFTHEDTMFFQVKIFDKDGKEIMTTIPLKADNENEPKLHNSHQASASCSSANGQARPDCVHLKDPERYLMNSQNPFFVKKLTKKNVNLFVDPKAIAKYGLKFGQANSHISFILTDGKEEEGSLNFFGGGRPVIHGWGSLCQKHNMKLGQSVVCELERSSSGRVTAIRVHLIK